MPIKKCQINGKLGYKWGDAGVCYTGQGAKENAIAQGTAALAYEAKKSGAKTKDEISKYIANHGEELKLV
jgi:hypothetical protein